MRTINFVFPIKRICLTTRLRNVQILRAPRQEKKELEGGRKPAQPRVGAKLLREGETMDTFLACTAILALQVRVVGGGTTGCLASQVSPPICR
jgi:hypothetical protein